MFALTTLLLLAQSAAPGGAAPAGAIAWDARAAEHLLNRAGFGARGAEVDAAVQAGLDATVERLLAPSAEWEMPAYEPIVEPDAKKMRELSPEEKQRIQREVRERDRRQLQEGTAWWLSRMRDSEDVLLEKMVLFWHGFFTTSVEDAKRSFLVLQQHEFLRRNALGSYADLLRGIVRDPAMLLYLDNQANRKGNPNENLARELMELFSLGEGNYTEADVKEAARALTGNAANRLGRFEFRARQHDDGEKTILGVTGNADAARLVEILLADDACPRWVARRLLAWFEGAEPDAARLDEYAACLRRCDYEVVPFLRKLFTDPRFYRDEIVGARVQSPIEYLVGISRRTRIDAPPTLLGAGAAVLGQRLFAPPSVKGWEEGYAWISTSTLMQRGNLAGFLLGVVKLDDVSSVADIEAQMAAESAPGSGDTMQDGEGMRGEDVPPEPAARPAMKNVKPKGPAFDLLRRVESSGWVPTMNLCVRVARTGARNDAQIVDCMLDELLAIRAPADTRARMRAFLAAERKELKIANGKLLDGGMDAERILRRLAHLILSLPEAQLG